MRRCAFILATMMLLLSLCGSTLAEAAVEDPIVVRVGDFSYSQRVVQGSLDSMLELSGLLRGDAPGETEKAARLQATVDSFVELGVIENKLAEAGQDGFTDAEREAMNQTARSKYEELWQLMYQQMVKNDPAAKEADVTARLEAMGYTFQAIYDELELQARQNRAIDLFCGKIVLTQDQVDAYYEEQFVAPDRKEYAGNVDKYDVEVLMNNNEAFYTPEGYRTIRQIVLDIPEEAKQAVRAEEVRLTRATQAMGTALEGLTMAVIEAESWTEALAEAKALYNEASEALEAAQSEYRAALEAAALPLVRDTTDEIMKQHDLGIDFKSLINKYSTDRTERNMSGAGYPFHPDSKSWPENFRSAAAALEKPGDISRPFVTEQGIHILCYAGDVPAGAHVLTEEERKLLAAAAERYYQLEKLTALVEGWKADYEIETHPELLKY